MKLPLFVVTLSLSATAFAQGAPIDRWTEAHPEATSGLEDWAKANGDTARRVFFWDRDHPLRAQFFLRWMVDHPDQGLDTFTAAHSDWPVVSLLLTPYHSGIEAFMAWGRAHPAAVRALTAQPKGLSWVAFNRLAEFWDSHLKPIDVDSPEQGARRTP